MEEGLLAKFPHISAFMSPTDERPRFDTTSVFLVMFFAEEGTMKHSFYTLFYKKLIRNYLLSTQIEMET